MANEATDEAMTDHQMEDTSDGPLMEAIPCDEPALMEGVVGIAEMPEELTRDDNQVVTSASEDPTMGNFTWTVHNYSTTDGKIFSDVFEAGGYLWNILLFPRGNKTDSLSVFLNVPDSESLPLNWSRRASFKLVLINQRDPGRSVVKESEHLFSSKEADWGFTQFVTLADVRDPQHGFVVDNSIQIRAEVRVDKGDGILYNSKKETGYVGLKNQGATCYMNSLLQTLYNINYFRQAVYHMPTTEEDVPSKSIPLALQSLFYKLQFGDMAVSTKDLTKSFGWDTYEAFTQHDVQELNRVLCEKLEDKMKGTKVEGTINKLFEGHTHNFIECIHVDYKSTRRESYMDLQLDVKDCKDVYDSFDRYCEIEQLEGDNKYKAEDHGLQEAKKGVLFDDFPPVLQLQLKRFEYDYNRDSMVKLNTRYKFYDELDLDTGDGKYLSPNADRTVRNKYKLHSVLVHSGGVHGGHYYAFIRPDGQTWLKFDDEKVTKEDSRRALDDQFGAEDEAAPPTPGYNHTPTFKLTKVSNAYMLVYVRVDDWPNIMCEVHDTDIAEHVRARLEKEREEKERKRIEKQEAHLFTFLRIATDQDLLDQIGKDRYFDLVDHDKVKCVKAKKAVLLEEVKQEIANTFNVSVDNMRLWHWAKRQNATYRPTRPLSPTEETTRVDQLRNQNSNSMYAPKSIPHNVNLFLETPTLLSPGALPPLGKNGQYLLFFKLYDPATRCLSYAGRLFMPRTAKRPELEAALRKMQSLPEATPLEVYEEVKTEPSFMIEPLEPHVALHNNQNEDGDIFIFQEAVLLEDEEKYQYPHAPGFLEYVKNRQKVIFKKLDSPKEDGLTLELSKTDTYDDVAAALAKEIMLEDPEMLRFTQHNMYTQSPKPQPVRYRQYNTLQDMLNQYASSSDTLYYEALDMPLAKLEQLKILKLEFHGERAGSEVQLLTVRVPKDSTVEAVCQQVREQLGPDYADRQFRLMEVFYNKIFKVCANTDKVDLINDTYWTVRVEAITAEEAVLQPAEFLLHVCHILPLTASATQATNFGDPFVMKVREEETLADIKPRLRAKVPASVSDDDFAKYKYHAVVNLRGPHPINDDDFVSQYLRGPPTGNDPPYLGLEHADNLPRRPQTHLRNSHYERPVKIYN